MKVNFFTIVLNGMPYIKYHLQEFQKLSFPWHWHIVEGLANLNGDTAWGISNGAYVPQEFHKNGLSIDGTTEYLDSIPEDKNVSIYRMVNIPWENKTEMVNQPLKYIRENCLLWQIDYDELWKAETIERVRSLFLEHPNKSSAYFYCLYFLGEKRYITSNNVKSTRHYDWLRIWRFKHGMRWRTHEPPCLLNDMGENVGKINPFTRDETMSKGLTFQHFAYSTLESVKFKEAYYGYKGLTEKWLELQNQRGTFVFDDSFPGVDAGTVTEEWDESKQGELYWKN